MFGAVPNTATRFHARFTTAIRRGQGRASQQADSSGLCFMQSANALLPGLDAVRSAAWMSPGLTGAQSSGKERKRETKGRQRPAMTNILFGLRASQPMIPDSATAVTSESR